MTIGGVDFDWKITFLIILTTVVPMLDYYNHKLTRLKAYDRLIWYFVIPALVIVLLFREPLTITGLNLGIACWLSLDSWGLCCDGGDSAHCGSYRRDATIL